MASSLAFHQILETDAVILHVFEAFHIQKKKDFIFWTGEGCQYLSTGSSQQKVGVEADLGGCLGGHASATTAANAPLHCLEPLSWSLSPSLVSEIESVHCLSVRSHVTCNFFFSVPTSGTPKSRSLPNVAGPQRRGVRRDVLRCAAAYVSRKKSCFPSGKLENGNTEELRSSIRKCSRITL